MNFLKFVVRLRSYPERYFVSKAGFGYLNSFQQTTEGLLPVFSDNPLLFSRRIAGAYASELRLSGYNARRFPYFFIQLRAALVNFMAYRKARRAEAAKWKKH